MEADTSTRLVVFILRGKFITRRSGSADAQFNYSRNFEMQGAVSVKRMHGHNAPCNGKL